MAKPLESLLLDTQIRVRELERENREKDAQLSKSLTFGRITYLLNEWGQYQARNMFLELEASLKTQEKP